MAQIWPRLVKKQENQFNLKFLQLNMDAVILNI